MREITKGKRTNSCQRSMLGMANFLFVLSVLSLALCIFCTRLPVCFHPCVFGRFSPYKKVQLVLCLHLASFSIFTCFIDQTALL